MITLGEAGWAVPIPAVDDAGPFPWGKVNPEDRAGRFSLRRIWVWLRLR
jgi:hypothetical protein